jgi:hypothetical protein
MTPSKWPSDHDAPPSPPGIPRDPAAATFLASHSASRRPREPSLSSSTWPTFPTMASKLSALRYPPRVPSALTAPSMWLPQPFPGEEWPPATRSPTTANPPKTQSSPFWEIRGRSASWRSALPPTFSRDSGAQPPALPMTTRSCSPASVYFSRKPRSGQRCGNATARSTHLCPRRRVAMVRL